MTLSAFLTRLHRLDVKVWMEGDRLRLSAPKGALTDELRAELERRRDELVAFLARAGRSGDDAPIPALPAGGERRLSFGQERFWFLQQLEAETGAYNLSLSLRLRGPLDPGALGAALGQVVARHGALRTTFGVGSAGQPVQHVAAPAEVDLPQADLTAAADPLAEARRRVSEEAARPFDLARGPLYRPLLVRLGDGDHVLALVMPHIVSDGWSCGVIAGELAELYAAHREARPPALPPLPVQYVDYAAWQRAWFEGGGAAELLAYWKRQLAGLPVLELPTDRPRPARQTYAGRKLWFELEAAVAKGLDALGHETGCTFFMTMLAAFDVLLARYSGQEDIVVGTPIAGRNRTETEPLVGLFLNTLVLRSDLSGEPTFRELLERVRETSLGAFTHQDMPFEQLVLELKPERDLSRNPLFQILFNVLHDGCPAAFGDLAVEEVVPEGVTSAFDLTLAVDPSGPVPRAMLEYNVDLFDAATIERLRDHLLRLLAGVAEQPDTCIWRLPMLTDDERHQALSMAGAALAGDAAELPFYRRFEQQAAARPDAVAVVCGDERVRYGELEAAANRLAHHLRALGAAPGVLVGVSVERSVAMVVALLAIMKSGAAYVPLDPGYPAERLSFIVEDAGLRLLVTQDALRDRLPGEGVTAVSLDGDAAAIEARPAVVPEPLGGPDDLVYVIFTSGSTGKPKGVQIEHRALANFLGAMAERPGFGAGDVLVAVTTISFDIAGLELYLPLATGGTVVLAAGGVESDGERLAALIAGSGATVVQATPATWQLLIESGWRGAPDLVVLCGGEALSRELADRLLERCGALWNMYGPTETTIWSLVGRVEPGAEQVVIGTPIASTELYVLDAHREPVPVGVPGRIWLGGPGLARGYWNRPELTAEKFVPHPFRDHGRLYDTGDLARRRADGSLEFLGRVDHQVKIRGFRIELGEIEHVLARHPDLAECAVVAQSRPGGERRLAAFAVARAGARPEEAAQRELLRRELPDYMVPAVFELLDALPLTPNGKVDRKALSARTPRSAAPVAAAAPLEGLERDVAAVWCEVLDVASVGRDDNFFDRGGHSLLIVQLRRRLQEACGVELSIAEVFQYPTVASMAGFLGRGAADGRIAEAQERGGKQRAAMSRFKKRRGGRAT